MNERNTGKSREHNRRTDKWTRETLTQNTLRLMTDRQVSRTRHRWNTWGDQQKWVKHSSEGNSTHKEHTFQNKSGSKLKFNWKANNNTKSWQDVTLQMKFPEQKMNWNRSFHSDGTISFLLCGLLALFYFMLLLALSCSNHTGVLLHFSLDNLTENWLLFSKLWSFVRLLSYKVSFLPTA